MKNSKPSKQMVSKYQKMKLGEYELHVLIQATSGLSIDNESDVDAMISLTAFGQTQYTKAKSNVGFEETFWGEHFYFSKSFDNTFPIEGQRLMFSVWDHNKVLQNSLIGKYEVDIQRIYSEKDHSIHHMWLALSNIEKDFSEITGYVKVSLSVLGEGDDNVELEVEPLSSITKEKKVLMPPNIQRKTYQLIVEIFNGKNIKPQDGKTVDSYIGVEFGQIYTITEPCMKTVTPEYGTRVYVPLALPAVTDNIVIRINDFNFIQKSEVIGSHYININRIIKQEGISGPQLGQSHIRADRKLKTTDLQWINFYGPQIETSNDEQKNVHQFFPELATYYVGSVLMKISIKEDTDPERRSELMEKKELKLEKKPPAFYSITARITAALNLFHKNKKYKIMMRVGADEISTDFVKCKNGFCLWATEKVMSITVEENQLVPDIFVYLVDDDDKKICYLRHKAKQGEIQEDKWINLKPDLSVVNLQNQEAGYLKIALSMEKVARHAQPVSKRISSPLSRIFENDKKNGKIVIELISAESLIPLDEDGSADPYFVFSYMQTEQMSSKKNDTLNPIYFEKIVLNAEIVDEESCPPIVVNVYDQDKISRDFIGTTFIDVGDGLKDKSIVYGNSNRPKPRWFEITQNGIMSGRFLASIILLQNYSGSIPPQINIPRAKFRLNLYVLGLRGLKSTGVLSVKKPYIEFDYENLNLFSSIKEFDKSKNVVTEPKESGSSVNINIFNKTTMMLPENPNYWPSLSAKVKDYVLGGIYEPILGFFALNLNESYAKSQIFIKNYDQNKKMVDNKKKIVNRSRKLEGINNKVLINLRNFILKSINYSWKVNSPNVNLLKKGERYEPIDKSLVCIFPHYAPENKKEKGKGQGRIIEKYKERILENKEYMKIGYDDKEKRKEPLDKRNKHYRYCLDCAVDEHYEEVYGCKMGICGETNIRKGRIFPSNDTASSVVRKVTTEDTYVGLFKGEFFITKDDEMDSKNEGDFKKKALESFRKISSTMKIYLFLYVIEAANLPPKDQFSHSDPYLVIRAGERVIDLEDQHLQDETNPQFYKKIRILLELPAESMVQVQVWDYDPVKTDELIGSTILDIQNRIFAENGSLSTNNPIETHSLKAKQSKLAQGLIRFWADLVPINQLSLYRQFQIGRKAASNYEVRIIVWGCKDMPLNDIEDMSDLFIVGMFNDEEQQTDVHYRSATGDGYFNWRMVFPVKLPIKNPLVTFKVYDKDLLTGNDFISSGSFSIAKYLEEVFETDTSTALYLGTEDLSAESDTVTGRFRMIDGQEMYDRFYINMRNKQENQDHDGEKVGKVEVSIEILTERDAKKKPAGKGRGEPNQHPHLSEPKGRFQWSLNPLKMINQLCGAGFKAKIVLAIICLLCIGFIVYFGASFGGAIAGGAIGG